MLFDDLRLELCLAVTRNCQLDLAVFRLDRFGGCPVAAITILF